MATCTLLILSLSLPLVGALEFGDKKFEFAPKPARPLKAEECRVLEKFWKGRNREWEQEQREAQALADKAKGDFVSSIETEAISRKLRAVRVRRLLNKELNAGLSLHTEQSQEEIDRIALANGVYGTSSPYRCLSASSIGYKCLQPSCLHVKDAVLQSGTLSQLFEALDPKRKARKWFNQRSGQTWLARLFGEQTLKPVWNMRSAASEADLRSQRDILFTKLFGVFGVDDPPDTVHEQPYALEVSQLIPLNEGLRSGGYVGKTDEVLGFGRRGSSPLAETVLVFEDRMPATWNPRETETFYSRIPPPNPEEQSLGSDGSNLPAELLGSLRGHNARAAMVTSPRKAVVLFPNPKQRAVCTMIYPEAEFDRGGNNVVQHRKMLVHDGSPLSDESAQSYPRRVLLREDGYEVTTWNDWLCVLALAWLSAAHAQQQLPTTPQSRLTLTPKRPPATRQDSNSNILSPVINTAKTLVRRISGKGDGREEPERGSTQLASAPAFWKGVEEEESSDLGSAACIWEQEQEKNEEEDGEDTAWSLDEDNSHDPRVLARLLSKPVLYPPKAAVPDPRAYDMILSQ